MSRGVHDMDKPNPPRAAARLGVAALLAAIALAASATEGTVAPDFALTSTSGTNYRLSEHRGEVVAILFWASWCGDCRRELERLEKLRRTYGSVGLVVLGVSLDKEPERAQALAAASGIGYPVLLDTTTHVSRTYRAEELPLIVLIDRSGEIRARHETLDEREERGLVVSLRDLIDE